MRKISLLNRFIRMPVSTYETRVIQQGRVTGAMGVSNQETSVTVIRTTLIGGSNQPTNCNNPKIAILTSELSPDRYLLKHYKETKIKCSHIY